MIKDTIKNINKYYDIFPELSEGFDFLQKNNLTKLKQGRYNLCGDNYVNIDEYETKISDNVEAHKKYIDIQYIIAGEEYIGVSDINNLKPVSDYDENKDIIFYNGSVNMNLMQEGEFMILYPEDAHLPCQMVNSPSHVKKAVVKIKTLQ